MVRSKYFVSLLLDRQVGDDTSAGASLGEALAIYTRLGAERDVRRLREVEIAQTGP